MEVMICGNKMPTRCNRVFYCRPLMVRFQSSFHILCRVRLKPDGTRWRTGGEVKGKLANGVDNQYSHTTSERCVSSITTADAHTSAASSQLNWHPRRFKWTRPFRRKTKSGFWFYVPHRSNTLSSEASCVVEITVDTQSRNSGLYKM